MASWSAFIWIHFCIQRASNKNRVMERNRWPVSYHSWSDDLCGLNLFIYSHICKKVTFLMLAAAILYIMYIIYTVHTSTYTQHKGIGIYPLIMGSPTTLSHTHLTLPRARELNDWCLTPQLKKGLKEDQCYSCPAHWLGDRTEVLRSSGAGKWVCNYWPYPLHHPLCNYCLYPLHSSGTASCLCLLLHVDATPMLTLHDAWQKYCHMVLKQQAPFVCHWVLSNEPASKIQILLRSSHPLFRTDLIIFTLIVLIIFWA